MGRTGLFKLLFLAASLLLLVTQASADIEPAEKPLTTSSTPTVIEHLIEDGASIPPSLRPNEVLIMARMSAANGVVLFLAPKSQSSKELAELLDKVVPNSDKVAYEDGEDFSSAAWNYSKGRFGQSFATWEMNFSAILAGVS